MHLFDFINHLPKGTLLTWLAISFVLDLITGIGKSVLNGVARTSTGYRKTIAKFLQYFGAIGVSIIMGNTLSDNPAFAAARETISFMNDGLLVFIIYIELTSVCENLIEASPESPFAKYFIVYLHRVLTFTFKNNPVKQIVEENEKQAA